MEHSQELIEQIRREYVDNQKSIREVSAHVGLSKDSVRKVLLELKVMRTQREGCFTRVTKTYRESAAIKKEGAKNHQAKLTAEDVLEIRRAYPKLLFKWSKVEAQRILAQQYGVRRPTISDVVLNRSWKRLVDDIDPNEESCD